MGVYHSMPPSKEVMKGWFKKAEEIKEAGPRSAQVKSRVAYCIKHTNALGRQACANEYDKIIS